MRNAQERRASSVPLHFGLWLSALFWQELFPQAAGEQKTMFSSKTMLSGPKGICYPPPAIQPPCSNLQAWWFPRTASLLTKTCLCLVPAELTRSVLPVWASGRSVVQEAASASSLFLPTCSGQGARAPGRAELPSCPTWQAVQVWGQQDTGSRPHVTEQREQGVLNCSTVQSWGVSSYTVAG